VKEVSLIYELSDYFKIERERDKLIKKISQLRASRQKLLKKDAHSKKLETKNSELKKSLVTLIHTVIKLHKFKIKFRENPESFYKSQRLFVTFKNFKIAKEFKDLYNKEYRSKKLSFLTSPFKKKSFKKLQANSKKNDPKPNPSSKDKLQRNEDKYVDVDTKLKYRGSSINSNLHEKMIELAEKQKQFEDDDKGISKTPGKQFYSERPKNYEDKMRKELKRGILSKMMEFYSRSATNEEQLKMVKMREAFGPDLKIKRSLEPKYINWDYHSDSELGRIEMTLYSFGVLVVMPAVCFYLNYQFFKLDLM
jgi:hypothetical protein